MLLSAFIREKAEALVSSYPLHEAGNMMVLLCRDRLGTESWTHIVEPDTTIAEDKLSGLEGDFNRLQAGEPLQYVLGHACFWGRDFKVDSRVLIPRPETELLVEEVEKWIGPSDTESVLDLCTGSGCIAWSLALDRPDCDITAVDISSDALNLASGQFQGPVRPKFIEADVLDAEACFGSSEFDVLVSNPPYVMDSEKEFMRKNVLEHEPHLALFVPDTDPLVFYKAIAGHASRVLKKGGKGMVEINEKLGLQTAAIFENAGFASVRILADLAGKDRFVIWNN